MEHIGFKLWLQRHGFAKRSIQSHCYNIGHYLSMGFCIQEQTEKQREEALNYISKQQGQGNAVSTINQRLGSLGHYYHFLGYRNPLHEIRLQEGYRKHKQAHYSPAELDGIFQEYSASPIPKNPVHQEARIRNEILLGLLVFQCLSSIDIEQLKTWHFDLDRAILQVPGSLRKNPRTLKLEGFQIRILDKYLQGKSDQEYLFPSVDNSLQLLQRSLRRLGVKVKTLNDLRESRIVELVKTVPLRELQYRLGFKYVSSLQAYELGNIEELQQAIHRHHPLNESPEHKERGKDERTPKGGSL